MFLLHSLAAFSVAFWIGALVAEVVMRSPQEAELSPGVRAGFGFMICLAYFSAAWQFMAIGYAWLLGMALLALYFVGQTPAWTARLTSARGYARAYAAFLGVAALFFLPMLLSWTFGPFTEAGGDISIYADTAKYLVDRGLTEAGPVSPDTASPLMFPPFADYATYRVVAAGTMSKFLYAPYATFSFLAGETNYAVFHGVQCLAYVLMVAGCWDFFRRHGRAVTILGTGMALASLALVSVVYNTYSAQAISLASCALLLAAVPRVRLVSWAGLRTFGCVLLLTWACYVHYLAVMLPIALVALMPAERVARAAPRLPAVAAAVAFMALLSSLAWAAARKSWEIAGILLGESFSFAPGIGTNQYMGEPVAAWSAKWLGFQFGIVSQQHVMPLAHEIGVVDLAMRAADVAGVCCVALGIVVTARAAASGTLRELRRDLALYVLTLLTIAVHIWLVRKSLYTQAKGAQNVLLLTYVAMVLPIAFAARGAATRGFDRVAQRVLIAAAAIFVALLLVPRAAFMVRFAGAFDRTSILEPSYFDEAERIRRADAQAFVLMEPRVSSDLYASSQSFFGTRMLPTRHMVLKKSEPGTGPYGVVAGMPDFIGSADLEHLWTLSPEREPRWEWLGKLPYVASYLPRPSYRTTWRAERLASRTRPALILSGDLYERVSERTTGTTAPPGFATLRNGAVSIFVPANVGATAVLTVRPPSAVEYGADAKITGTQDAVRLEYALPSASNAAFRVIARCKDQCFVRAQLDGRDVD